MAFQFAGEDGDFGDDLAGDPWSLKENQTCQEEACTVLEAGAGDIREIQSHPLPVRIE